MNQVFCCAISKVYVSSYVCLCAGLGTSSVLGGAIMAALWRASGWEHSRDSLIHAVSSCSPTTFSGSLVLKSGLASLCIFVCESHTHPNTHTLSHHHTHTHTHTRTHTHAHTHTRTHTHTQTHTHTNTHKHTHTQVLHLEQLLTTGGGWQDQCGGLYGGVKISHSQKQLPVHITTKQIGTESMEAHNYRSLYISISVNTLHHLEVKKFYSERCSESWR